MKLVTLIPTYKRPEYLERTLASIGSPAGPVLVVDDGTPGHAVAAVVKKQSVTGFLETSHVGMLRAMAQGIHSLVVPVMDDDDALMLLANDHALPVGWEAAITAGAEAGLKLNPTGQIDHIPGLRLTKEWRSEATPVSDGVAIRTGRTNWEVTCSLPSLWNKSSAIGFADFILNGGIDEDDRQPFSAQKTYHAYFKGKTFFYLIGSRVRIDHFGHNKGLRAGYIKSDEHEDYYREIGRRRPRGKRKV